MNHLTASVETLLEALPYIREFHGRTVVIKYGGAAMSDETLRDGFATDVVLLKYVGLNPVIVHGGGPEITDYMERLGMEVKFVEGVRVSDQATVEVAKMVLLGKVNSDIVMRLGRHGQPAVGLSGEDGALFGIRPHARADDFGFVGEIESVSVDVIDHIAEDYIPVIASVGVDGDGNSYNVNADTAAGKVAAALTAHKAIFLTDVAGLARRPRRRGLAQLAGQRRRGRGGARVGLGRDAAEARRLRRGGPGRGGVGPHHRRPPPAQPAARAVHRRRHRHDGHPVSVSELQALESRYAIDTYARAPVEFVRGSGARLWDADGKEYLDFFAGLSVHNAGHCHPRIVAAISEQAATLAGSSNLFYSAPAMRAEPSGWRSRASAGASSSATRAPRRASARSSWSASAPTPAGSSGPRSSPSRAPSTAARSGRSPRPRSSPATTSSGRCPRASSPFRVTIRRRCATLSASGPRR